MQFAGCWRSANCDGSRLTRGPKTDLAAFGRRDLATELSDQPYPDPNVEKGRRPGLDDILAGATAFWELPDAEVWCRCLQWGRLRRLQDEGRRTSTHVHAADALIRIERIGSSEYNCLLDARKPRFEAMDAGIAHYPSTDQTH